MLSFAVAALLLRSSISVPLPSIAAKGLNLVDSHGHTVALRGVNLGGWLVEEIWMTPWQEKAPTGSGFSDVRDHSSLWDTVEKRLGREGMIRVRNAWRESWITDYDFERIKRAGFNHVRIPFLASIVDEPGGMAWLHRAVNMASAHGLYTVLDMHGLPGSQSKDHHTGKENQNRLWFDVDNIARAEQDWAKVAKEFGADSNVAAFDLMNEPMGAPNTSMLYLVYDRLYRAVRAVAPNKVLIIEDGYKGFDNSPHPNLAQWTDIAYSLHFYDFNAKKPSDHLEGLQKDLPKVKELLSYRQTPMYVGEWNNEPFGGAEVLRQYASQLDDAGFSWALWTWKLAPATNPMGDWGLVRASGGMPTLNAFEDSEATLISKIRQYQSKNLVLPPAFMSTFKRRD